MDNRDQVVVVKGLGRHLELQELKKKQDEEKKLREAEVFGVNHKFAVNAKDYDINNPDRLKLLSSSNSGINLPRAITVPQPFSLS